MATTYNNLGDMGKALQAMVAKLPRATQKQVVEPIMRDAAMPILNESKANTPVRSGELKAAQNIKVSFTSRGVDAKIGVTNGRDAPHAHLVEFGTQPRIQKKTGKSTGAVRGHHFLRNAAQSQGPTALARLSAGIRAAIDKAVKS